MRRLYLDEFHPVSQLKLGDHTPPIPRFPIIDMHGHMGSMMLGENYSEAYDTSRQAELLRECGLEALVSLELVWGESFARLRDKLSPEDGFFKIFPSVDLSGAGSPGFEKYVYNTLLAYRKDGVKCVKLWKNITLTCRGPDGGVLRLDSKWLAPVFAFAGELGLPVVIHVGDPPPFFQPNSPENEYYQCLCEYPEWSFCRPGIPSFEEHLEMQENMLAGNPDTVFVVAHVGSYSENLAKVSQWLESYPNMYIDVAARIDQLGRQPYTAREFLIRYQDRILFGSDYVPNIKDPRGFYGIHRRFFETRDEYFDHPFAGFLGNWKIYGVGLEENALKKIYRDNAKKILKL